MKTKILKHLNGAKVKLKSIKCIKKMSTNYFGNKKYITITLLNGSEIIFNLASKKVLVYPSENDAKLILPFLINLIKNDNKLDKSLKLKYYEIIDTKNILSKFPVEIMILKNTNHNSFYLKLNLDFKVSDNKDKDEIKLSIQNFFNFLAENKTKVFNEQNIIVNFSLKNSIKVLSKFFRKIKKFADNICKLIVFPEIFIIKDYVNGNVICETIDDEKVLKDVFVNYPKILYLQGLSDKYCFAVDLTDEKEKYVIFEKDSFNKALYKMSTIKDAIKVFEKLVAFEKL